MARSDRNGKRKSRESSHRRIPDLGYYVVLTDTDETEANYLNAFRESLPKEVQGRIVIRVSKAKTEDLVQACSDQAAMEPQYGEPWIVFDRDRVKNFDEIISDAKRKGINVGWSNPCIEIWFDAYFGQIHSYQDSVTCCREFAATFQKQTGKEYEKGCKQLYHMLTRYGNEGAAINLAQRRLRQHLREGKKKPSEMCPCTTVHHLIEEIRKKVDRENLEDKKL